MLHGDNIVDSKLLNLFHLKKNFVTNAHVVSSEFPDSNLLKSLTKQPPLESLDLEATRLDAEEDENPTQTNLRRQLIAPP